MIFQRSNVYGKSKKSYCMYAFARIYLFILWVIAKFFKVSMASFTLAVTVHLRLRGEGEREIHLKKELNAFRFITRPNILRFAERCAHYLLSLSLVVYLYFLMNTGKEESIINSRFFFRWIIIIFFLFKQFHYFIDRCFFFCSLFSFVRAHISKLQMAFWWQRQLRLDCYFTFWVKQSSGEHSWKQNKVLKWKWWSKSNQLNRYVIFFPNPFEKPFHRKREKEKPKPNKINKHIKKKSSTWINSIAKVLEKKKVPKKKINAVKSINPDDGWTG